METSIRNVVVTRDGGHECWDTTISAREIAKAFKNGLIEIDPHHQRGVNNVTGQYQMNMEKVQRWTRQLQEDSAIFGQLTWNFREDSEVRFVPSEAGDNAFGSLVIDGTAYLPDSAHRHYAIKEAVNSVAHGSSFDPDRRFSLRIWRVPEEFENDIFYAMNMEHDKADATRSKWLAQKNKGQKIARELVRQSPHLGDGNVETVTNTLSIKNPRLAAFNTLASGFEEAWEDIDDADAAIEWLLEYWDKLATVVPELRKLSLPDRQRARKHSIAGWAIAIQGYIRLARQIHDGGYDLSILDKLSEPEEVDGERISFFSWENPKLQRAGILVPSVNKAGETKLTARNSHQTRRAMADVLAEKIGI